MSSLFNKSKRNLSIQHEVTVRGYVIKRMPIGAYVQAIEMLNTKQITEDLMAALFPGMKIDAIFKYLKTIDTGKVSELLMRAFAVVPQYIAMLVSSITGVPEDKLMEDPEIGLDGLAEIIEAWVTINNIETFMKAAQNLLGKIMTQAANSGSKN